MTTIVRATIAHVPRDPFEHKDALEAFADGGLAFADGRIVDLGEFAEVRAAHPRARVRDERGAVLLPGLVDCHVHYPQLGLIGAMGLELLDWLKVRTLPEEARLADPAYARETARDFVRALARNGTTTALVFGSHFAAAQEQLFEAAAWSGLRIASGPVVSDRELLEELHTTPERAEAESRALIERWHGRGRLRYAITPRFSVSCSDEMLAVCGRLRADHDGVLFTSHVNESPGEIALVRELFPDAEDYLATYERHGLVDERCVLAHDVHPTDGELRRLAAARAAIAHCPSSNAFLGSGVFPMRRHLERGVRLALGTDVGAGTTPSMLGEALAAYQMQLTRPEGTRLGPAHALHLATAAGAAALGLAHEVGDLSPGKLADYVLVRPSADGTLAAVLARSPSIEATLGAIFALAREDAVAEVRVGGDRVIT